jgi:hypothetical protein
VPNNFIPIATQTLSSAASSISFNSIASTYTHLLIKAKVRVNSGFTQGFSLIRFNGVSTSTYRTQGVYIRGTTDAIDNNPSGSPVSSGFFDSTGSGATGDPWTYVEIWIPNYKSTTATRKMAVVKSNITQAGGNQGTFMGAFSNTSLDSTAITSVNLIGASGYNFAVGSTATLYGYTIEATSLTKYLVQQTFTSSGTFTVPTGVTSLQVLCVGGGGGGGGGNTNESDLCGGGGGGGGLTYHNNFSVTPGASLSYTIGAGGGAGIAGTNPTVGGDTNFSTIIAKGGGRGGHQKGTVIGSNTGGSGGGSVGGGGSGSAGTQGSGGTNYEQNSGGPGNEVGGRGGGGGGGASAAGGGTAYNTGVQKGGDGGQGSTTYLNSNYYGAGGGGGGNSATSGGGYLGGGNGGSNSSASTAGTANTGGGGGGGGRNQTSTGNGSAGGSGVIVVRYAGA